MQLEEAHLPTIQNAPCDATSHAQGQADDELARMKAAWNAVARYRLTLSAEGDWNKKKVVEEWLTYAAAVELRERMNRILDATDPNARHWGCARYGIELITPTVHRGSRTAVQGDLLFHQVVVPHGPFALSECVVVRQFFLPAEILGVVGGRIQCFRDRHGVHYSTPRNPHVISASELDVEGFLASVAAEEARRGHWAAEFGSPRTAHALLVRHQRLRS